MTPEESTTPDLVERWRQMEEEMEETLLRRDFDAGMGFFAPDAVWDASSAGIDRSEGATAIRSFLEAWLGAYEEYEHKQEEAPGPRQRSGVCGGSAERPPRW